MKRIYILSLLVCFLFLLGCYNYIDAEKGGYLPKRKKFQFQNNPYQLKKTDPIRSDVVYVTIDTFKYGDFNEYQKLHFYKFYNNGRYHKGFVNALEKNTANDYNDLFLLGYYNIDVDSIAMEYFFVKVKERGDMRTEIAFMRMDTLCFSVLKKTEAGLYYLRYVPRKIEGLDQNTHW